MKLLKVVAKTSTTRDPGLIGGGGCGEGGGDGGEDGDGVNDSPSVGLATVVFC